MHNYQKKLLELIASGKLSKVTGLADLNISHDDWCLIFRGGECNCDPQFTFNTGGSDEERVKGGGK